MIFRPDSRISDLARNLRQKYTAFTIIIIIIKRIFIHAPTSTSGVGTAREWRSVLIGTYMLYHV